MPRERWVKAEFHCHTVYSKDSLTELKDLLKRAEKLGIDRLCITDHNTIQGALKAKSMDAERVIVGEEILTTQGELLAFFVKEEIPARLEPQEAIARLRDQGAFISVSHPYDLNRYGWELDELQEITPLVDAIEVFNARCIEPAINTKAQEYALEHQLLGTVGSDAHGLSEVGRCTLELPAFNDAESLRASLKLAEQNVRLSSPSAHIISVWARIVKHYRASRKTKLSE